MQNNIKVKSLVSKLKLKVVFSGNEDATITVQDVSIPTAEICEKQLLQKQDRVKVIGTKEQELFAELNPDDKKRIAQIVVSDSTPCIITSRDSTFPKEIIEVAKERNVPLFTSQYPTSIIVGEIYSLLANKLDPTSTSIHGVFLKINDLGVLIKGVSGIGKSEIAAELIQRGHLLIADDRILVREIYPGNIIGSAPENIRGYLELRGIGVVNIKKIFGESSVTDESKIDIIIELRHFEKVGTFDRLGGMKNTTTVLSTDVDTLCIPISEGRNPATLIEIAAKHYNMLKRGYTLEEDFLKNLHEKDN